MFELFLYIAGAFVAVFIIVMFLAFLISLATGKPFKQVIGIKSAERKEEDRKYPLSAEEKIIAFVLGFVLDIVGVIIVFLYYYSKGQKVKGENLGSYAFYGFLASLLLLCAFMGFTSLVFS